MIIYKDVLNRLSEAGYNTYRLRKEKILSESTLTKIRQNKPISLETLDVICQLTNLQPSDLIEHKREEIP